VCVDVCVSLGEGRGLKDNSGKGALRVKDPTGAMAR